ncbi:hypothetical protein [Candidatus Palauibacter sp.]|uniref:hypothetical protein n=1 Tax=Candidatus Palauibacter sp. TaxID=3101350 RepID=UPI003AF2A771
MSTGPQKGDFDLARDEVLGGARDRQPEEREDGSDLDGSGFARRIPGDVAVAPHSEVGVARVEPDDGRVGRERLLLGGGVGHGVGRCVRRCNLSLFRLFRRWNVTQRAHERGNGHDTG